MATLRRSHHVLTNRNAPALDMTKIAAAGNKNVSADHAHAFAKESIAQV